MKIKYEDFKPQEVLSITGEIDKIVNKLFPAIQNARYKEDIWKLYVGYFNDAYRFRKSLQPSDQNENDKKLNDLLNSFFDKYNIFFAEYSIYFLERKRGSTMATLSQDLRAKKIQDKEKEKEFKKEFLQNVLAKLENEMQDAEQVQKTTNSPEHQLILFVNLRLIKFYRGIISGLK